MRKPLMIASVVMATTVFAAAVNAQDRARAGRDASRAMVGIEKA